MSLPVYCEKTTKKQLTKILYYSEKYVSIQTLITLRNRLLKKKIKPFWSHGSLLSKTALCCLHLSRLLTCFGWKITNLRHFSHIQINFFAIVLNTFDIHLTSDSFGYFFIQDIQLFFLIRLLKLWRWDRDYRATKEYQLILGTHRYRTERWLDRWVK